jgi:hypothetical protein
MATIKSYFKKPEIVKKIISSPPERQMVVATYHIECFFKIPKHIDLENKKQVKTHWVKWNVLHIEMVNGKTIEVETDRPNDEMKYPDEINIESAEDCFDESEDEEEK